MTNTDNAREIERHIRGATIAWGPGDYLDLANPDHVEVTVEDYAYCLAYTPRWRGQTRTRDGGRPFFGVAQHCVFGAEEMIAAGHSNRDAFAFLFHESDEIPFGDFPGPAKRIPEVAATCALAKRIGASIDRKFGVVTPDPALVKRWDIRMLVTEKRDLLVADYEGDGWEHHGEDVRGYEPFERRIEAYPHPQIAALRFLELYRQLGGA